MISLLRLLSVMVLLFSASVFAQDDETETPKEEVIEAFVGDEDLDVEEKITSSPDVVPSSAFTRFSDGRLPLGKVVELILGFKNIGQKSFNVTSIHGSFRYPSEMTIYVQNFTAWRGGSLVRPAQHLTFLYYFYPDDLLEPKDYAFISTVSYSDEENVNYTTTFYNGTIYMIEESTSIDFQTIFTYFLLLSVVALIGYVVFLNLPKKMRGSAVKATVETGTRASGSDWTSDALGNKSLKSSKNKT